MEEKEKDLLDFMTGPLDRYERMLAARYGIAVPDDAGPDHLSYARARRAIWVVGNCEEP